jgi:hypothetical protein
MEAGIEAYECIQVWALRCGTVPPPPGVHNVINWGQGAHGCFRN